MAQTLAWLITILLIAAAFWALARDYDRRRQRTVEEYEREAIEQKNSLLRAGLIELDKFAGHEKQKRAAVEYLKDEQQGQTKTGGKSDDADRTMDEQQ